MKQIFLDILIIFSIIPSIYGQKIALVDENSNGRFISTDFLPIYKSGNRATGSVSLGVAYNTAMQTIFCLNLRLENESNISISKGSALQLLTEEGESIVLHNTSDITEVDHTLIVSYGVQYNEVELADLDKVMNERIVKIKIETDNGIIERDITDNLFSQSVYKDFIVLKDYLEKQRDDD